MGGFNVWAINTYVYIGLTLIIRVPFFLRHMWANRCGSDRSEPLTSENRRAQLIDRILLVIFLSVGIAAIYLFAYGLLGFAQLPFTEDVSWVGMVVAFISLCLLLWAHVSLGDSWSGIVQKQRGHQLKTGGIYRFARHPMYTSFFLQPIAILLLVQNWAYAALWALWTIYAASRIGAEERLMLRLFGRQYADYKRRVGAFVPFKCPFGGWDCGLSESQVECVLSDADAGACSTDAGSESAALVQPVAGSS
jgi:protein-S-isoprenylcysteine O-methyltransferase Ste14